MDRHQLIKFLLCKFAILSPFGEADLFAVDVASIRFSLLFLQQSQGFLMRLIMRLETTAGQYFVE